MSVLVETSLGDLVLDLDIAHAPKAATNFIKLCKIKYFNDACFFNLQKGFTISCGDPTVPPCGALTDSSSASSGPNRIRASKGGDSIFGIMYGAQARCFPSELAAASGHSRRGTVSMVCAGGDHNNTSAFFITLTDQLTYLDGRHTVFAHVAEGIEEFIEKLKGVLTDENGKPKQNIKIRHTIVLEGHTHHTQHNQPENQTQTKAHTH